MVIHQQQVFSPAVQEIIERAQRLAHLMNAAEFDPAHVVLSALTLNDTETTRVFNLLELDSRTLRKNAETVFNNLYQLNRETPPPSEQHLISPSPETQQCLHWATTFAEQHHAIRVEQEHLLPAVMRHPQVQPILILLLSSYETIPTYITDPTGQEYTSAFDQLIQIKIRAQKHIHNRSTRLSLTNVTRPTLTFQDILGAHASKQPLRDLVTFLRKPSLFSRQQASSLCNLLLLGHPCTERTLLVQAVAGEAVVPLTSLSISALVELVRNLQAGTLNSIDLRSLREEYPFLQDFDAIRVGRQILHSVFETTEQWAPCLLLLDDLDAFNRLDLASREPLQQQLLDEMDGVNWHPPLVIVATTHNLKNLAPELTCPGHFDHHVTFSESYMTHPAAQIKLCLSCKKEVLSNWQYCIYCGTILTQICSRCGAPHIEVEGSLYCFQCGNLLDSLLNVDTLHDAADF